MTAPHSTVTDPIEGGPAPEQHGPSWSLLELLPDSILLADAGGRVCRATSVAGGMFGWEPSELVGMRVAELLEQDARKPSGSKEILLPSQQPAMGYRFLQARGRRKDTSAFGCEVGILTLASPIEGARWVVTVRPSAHREFQESRVRESVKMAALADLAACAANDFNNQLTAISGNLESAWLEIRESGGPGVEKLATAREATRRAARVVRRLSNLSNPAPSVLRPIDVTDVVSRAVAAVEPELRTIITINTTLNHGDWVVNGDAEQLVDILINCCLNARDAMPTGGLVTIATHRAVSHQMSGAMPVGEGRREHVRIDITDTGDGIPAEILPRIFDPFFTTKKNAPGAGLGLAAVYDVLAHHEGGVSVESTVGAGTTVHIFLPRTIASGADPAPAGEAASGNETILVIDDEAMVRQIARLTLEGCGYTVLEAADGSEGLQLYRQEQDRIGLVLLDLVMPGKTGLEVLAALRKITASVPVILVSGGPADLPEDGGANAFIAKPYELRHLTDTVGRLLREQHST